MSQPVTVPYITLAEVKEYLQINSQTYDNRLNSLISYACAVVESYIGREVKSNNYSETFDGGTAQVFVSRLPLNSVTRITEFDGTAHSDLIGPKSDGSFVAQNFLNSTVTSSATLKTRRKKFGESSAYFSGASAVTVNDPEGNNKKFDFQSDDFTMEGFFRFEDLTGTRTLMSLGNANNFVKLEYNPYLGINFRSNRNDVEVANVYHYTSATDTESFYVNQKANTFFHAAVSRADSSLRLFVDGTTIRTQTTSNSLPSGNSLTIGSTGISGSENYFKGYMDEIRVTIDSRYASTFTVPTTQFATDDDTVALLHFNGKNGSSTLKDSSRQTPQYVWNSDTGGIKRYSGGTEGTPDISVIPELTFKNYPRGITVNYNAGYTNIPQDLKVATLDYVKILHKQTQENAGFSLQGETAKQHGLSSNFPAHIRRVLEMYRIMN